MVRKARTIKLCREKALEEELLPQQTLLHIYFEDNWGNAFRWTPAIRGGEVEQVFFKMLEVEEKNNPKGAWSEELKEAAKRVPSLREFELPVQIEFTRLEEVREGGVKYFVRVSILPGKVSVGINDLVGKEFYIGDCVFKMESLSQAVAEKGVMTEGIVPLDRPRAEWCQDGQGITFYIALAEGFERLEYQIMVREAVGAIRSYIRSVLLDSKAIKRGFEDEQL